MYESLKLINNHPSHLGHSLHFSKQLVRSGNKLYQWVERISYRGQQTREILSNSDKYIDYIDDFENRLYRRFRDFNYYEFNKVYTMLVIIFWDILMFDKIYVSPQVKRIVIISNKHGIQELSHELPNDLRLRTLGN